MPTFTEFDLQESFPLCPHCADDALAKRIEERFLSFEMFDDIDDLKLQEVMTEVMRNGAAGVFLQQAPLSLRDRVRENLSSYNRDRLDADLRVNIANVDLGDALARTIRPVWIMEIRNDVSLGIPQVDDVPERCPVCRQATIVLENLRRLAKCPDCGTTVLFDAMVSRMKKMSFVASMPPGMVSEFTRRYLSHIHVRSLATLFKPCTEEELEGTLAKFPRGLRMDIQDRLGAIEEPGEARILSASHHILAAVFTQCFDEDLEDVGFVVPSERSLPCDRCGARALP